MSDTVVIAHRFRGPEGSGNGGYSGGVVASFIEGPAEVTLRAPPPLDRPLDVVRDGARVLLRDGERLIAEGEPTAFDLDLPEPPSLEEAERAERAFPGYANHGFPECFVCGVARSEGDGLRLFPGAVEGRALAAARFMPTPALGDASGLVDLRFVWSALDCPSWWGYVALREEVVPVLLGRLAVTVRARPRVDEPCVVVGWPLAREGRRILCGSALFGEGGSILAYARATWVELKK